MVHLVYPSATHDRLSHSIGVVEIATRMLIALSRNAKMRVALPRPPLPDDEDFTTIRLAALLHDIGHAAFSHASERVIEFRFAEEFKRLVNLVHDNKGMAAPAPPKVSELIAVMLVMSSAMDAVYSDPLFAKTSL